MCSSLKYTSYGKPSSPSDLLRPTCFNASWISYSVTNPSQVAASEGSQQNNYETPEPEGQDNEQSDHGSAPERPRDAISP